MKLLMDLVHGCNKYGSVLMEFGWTKQPATNVELLSIGVLNRCNSMDQLVGVRVTNLPQIATIQESKFSDQSLLMLLFSQLSTVSITKRWADKEDDEFEEQTAAYTAKSVKVEFII
ncbi:hypothetical protein ACFE04_000352 [Oxalis oulophora]